MSMVHVISCPPVLRHVNTRHGTTRHTRHRSTHSALGLTVVEVRRGGYFAVPFVRSALCSLRIQVLFQATPAQWATGCADMLCDIADREAESSDTHTHGSLDTAGLDRAALQRAGVGCLIQTVK